MSTNSNRSNDKPWSQFRSSTQRKKECALLDAGRAEVMLNMLELPRLLNGKARRPFLKAVHDASKGDPKALKALLSASGGWGDLSAADINQLKTLWASFKTQAPTPNAMTLLRRACQQQRCPLPPSMIEALFDDASFDFVAYLKWHNS